MRSYLNIIPFIFYAFFNAHFSIFHTESLVKMSNSLWFSRIFTLQSFRWFCFKFFDFSLGVLEKRLQREWEFFYNHWIWKFSKFQFFSFPFLKFIDFKITTNSFIYSLVEQSLETHFLKNNTGRKGVYFFNLSIFSGLYTPPYLGCGVYYTNNKRTIIQNYWLLWK